MKIMVLCKVIDNYGDIGVVYRLCRALSDLRKDLELRIVVNNLEAFKAMADSVDTSKQVQEFRGWEIYDWNAFDICKKDFEEDLPGLILECFQCGRPEWLDEILFSEEAEQKDIRCQIVNIEYLTAEQWADDFHLLKSGTRSARIKKVNFMPGFTPKTGGLILDKHFLQCLNGEVLPGNRPDSAYFNILMFSYPQNFDFFIKAVNRFNKKRKTRVYAAGGAGFNSFMEKVPQAEFEVITLPFLNQEEWDAFLCSMDFLFIRGEDSFARAALSGIPFLWNIYPQDEEFHLVKLKAFLDRLNVTAINEFSWLYNRNFDMEEGSEALEAWSGLNKPKTKEEAQQKMEELLYGILNSSESLKKEFSAFAKKTLGLGNLAENLLNSFPAYGIL